MAKEYKDTMSKLGAMLKHEPVKTPIQEVRPVESESSKGAVKKEKTPKEKEAHANFYLPESLMERAKIHAVRSKKTLKTIYIEALEQYLPKDKE